MGARQNQLLRILVFSLLQHCIQISLTLPESETKVYIVYLGEKQHDDPLITKKSHHKMLSTVLGSKEAAKSSILYSYKHGFSGFAARLTEAQAKRIEEIPGVLQVFPNRISKSHTTRSWDFLGLNYPSASNLLTKSNMGRGVIIGVIDTGVWPESESFNDKDMDTVPPHWKGICQKGDRFNSSNCNKKIIGAQYFSKGVLDKITDYNEYLSPRDENGHGTHTASTAAGYFVEKANYRGLLASGLARGGAPLAHLSIYKACWFADGSCNDIDVLAAFDQAICDGVDIISASLGPNLPLSSYIDQDNPYSIGSFHAISKGIAVVMSAGNDGPLSQTVENTAPWIITVGASTIDRSFQAAITLGNNQTLWGISMDTGKSNHGFISLAYSERVAVDSPNVTEVKDCQDGSFNATLAEGKIILCFSKPDTAPDIVSAADTVMKAGGVGLIFAQSNSDLHSPCEVIPCIQVDFEVGTQILTYIKRASSPLVKMSLPKTAIGDLASPRVATFSSRGPSSLTPSVLKPDIIAPGVDILAAAPDSKPTDMFQFMSGTSMSCPHVSGIVALIKSIHRDWSPAAIRSALVTTASQTGKDGMHIFEQGTSRKPANPFDIGGGHVNPNKAMNPGLVYDITPEEYIQFLCSLAHNSEFTSRRLMTTANCKKNNHMGLNLNLPSISIPNLSKTVTVTRTVTNVGHVNSVDKAQIEAPYGIKMAVKPPVLSFNKTNQILSFQVTFSAEQFRGDYTFGSLTWTDGEHFVRSPMAIRAVKYGSYYEV